MYEIGIFHDYRWHWHGLICLFINIYFWSLWFASFDQMMSCAPSNGFVDWGDIEQLFK